MSSVGQAVGGIVGGIVGFFFGVPMYGAQIGMMLGGMLDPPKIKGPRLDDLSFQTSTYGAIIPRVYGTVALHGNIFWLKHNKLTETSTTSSAKGGPELTTYHYSATFAVGLCQGPIEGVRRIWIGAKLWYDSGSDDIAAIVASNEHAHRFTLYLGSDTQTADPLIQADKGVANVPAYRGLAYIVFDALPLEKYGNSLMGAQVKVEVVKDMSSSAWARSVTNTAIGVTPSNPYILSADNGVIRVGMVNSVTDYTFDYDGVLLGSDTGEIPVLPIESGYYPCGKFNDVHLWAQDITPATGPALCFEDADASVGAGEGERIDYNLPSDRKIIGAIVANDGLSVMVICGDVGVDSTSTNSDALWYLLDSSGTVIDDGTCDFDCSVYTFGYGRAATYHYASSSFDQDSNTLATVYGAGTGVCYHYSIDDSGVMSQTLIGNLSNFSAVQTSCYLVGGVVFAISSNDINIFTSGLVSISSSTLGDIVEAECLQSGIIDASDIDVTELTDSVRGYRVSQLGSVRAAIEPLRAVWPFDVVMHGYDIQFKRRGSASVATISASDLDARPAGKASGVEITDGREMDLVLPQKISIKYLDSVREYDINEQSDERANTDAVNHTAIDMPVVLNGDEAKQTASMLLYLMWLERYDVAFSLPPEYLQLEPGDVITVNADNATYNLRLVSIQYTSDGRLECKAKYEAAAIYTQTSQGEDGQSTGGNLSLSGPTEYQLLDIPLMRDDDDTAGFPVAICGFLDGWPGGTLFRSEDGGESWSDLVASTYPGAVIGTASTTLSAHGGTVIDFASTLTIRPYYSTLASVTEAQLFAGHNWFAYGSDGRWEIIAAMTVTDNGNGTYTLRDFLRGQNGTEWATGLHTTNDRIVLLDESSLMFVSVNSSSIGSEKLYRGITVGQAIDSDTNSAFTYTGVNLECLSPCQLTGNRSPSTNTWTMYWTRRSRFAGWRDYVDAALGEASEAYVIEIYSDAAYTTLKRTFGDPDAFGYVGMVTTPTVSYSSANQVTDFGSNQSTLYVKIYQLSATVGRGYPLTQSITR